MYGVRKLRSIPRRLQGAGSEPTPSPHSIGAIGKIGAPPTDEPFQLRLGITTELTAIVPVAGVVTPFTTMGAPVGIVARPMVVAFCTFSCTSNVSIEMVS